MSRQKKPRAGRSSLSVICAITRERQRIAHDLHDRPAQTLAWVIMCLAGLEQHEACQAVRSTLQDLRRQLQEVSRELRLLVHNLSPQPNVDGLLDDAMRAAVREMHQHFPGSPSVLLNLQGPKTAVPPQALTPVIRGLKELLANLRRHSRADQALLSSSCQQDCVVLTLTDCGQGFDTQNRGFGLQSIAGSLAKIGARLEIDSQPGVGTCARIRLPRLDQTSEGAP
ncbi:sensor histidine kinase [Pseudomonas sp. 18175]|uniref:sensor histidine kinase n=1 Tax=Pseudomonas sp. 18175 TaxID=3390056 RepID=UPI003D1F1A94